MDVLAEWQKRLNPKRRKDKAWSDKKVGKTPAKGGGELRTEIERDHDRILFSTPVRRLADKTQVFPLERNDSVRSRLIHSIEVSNLARSIGTTIAFSGEIEDHETLNIKRNIPAMLAAIGIAHDLGNPPFGHQGENAIRSWFEKHPDVLEHADLTEAMKNDFHFFEGNAQTLRLLTRLQLLNDDYGLNVTYGTLAALMKYTVPSNKIEQSHIASKKNGFFQSEATIVEEIWRETGLGQGKRHPLTYIMEACDDIAYSVLDAEDAVKKGLVSFSDLVAFLNHYGENDPVIRQVCELSYAKHNDYRQESLSPGELNDISMQMFRVYAIGAMMQEAIQTFYREQKPLLRGNYAHDLLEKSGAEKLRKLLKKFDRIHAYRHRAVLEIELTGYNVISGLMDYLWMGIHDRVDYDDPKSDRNSPFTAYIYSRVSENYRRVFEKQSNMPMRYRELQLLTDMIAGMTDSYAITLLTELKKHDDRRQPYHGSQ